VSFTTVEIVRVMSRGDLHSTSTEVHVDEDVVSDNFHHAIGAEWMFKLLADEIFIAGILRVDSDGDITEHGLKSSSSDNKNLIGTLYFVREFSKLTEGVLLVFAVTRDLNISRSVELNVLNFNVRESGVEGGTPVD
jgi:hypothetical protein